MIKSQLHNIVRLLRRRGATREDAEDLVQEAVLRLCIYTHSGRQVRDEHAFVAHAAMNLAVDAHRHLRRDRYEREPVEDLDIADCGPTLDEIFAGEQRLHKMMATLDRVSLRTREVFLLHRLQGLSHAEIAKKLRISTSAVEKHIASAATHLAIDRRCE